MSELSGGSGHLKVTIVIGLVVLTLASCAFWNEPDAPHAGPPELAWTLLEGAASDGAINHGEAGGFYPQLARFNEKLYITWYEAAGGSLQIRVAVFSNGWKFVDGGGSVGINRVSGQDAFWSRLIVHDGGLYCYWHEAVAADANTIRIARYNGDDTDPSWEYIDGSESTGLRATPDASAEYASLATYGDELYAAWRSAEGGPYQIRVSRLITTSPSPVWESVDGGTVGINIDANLDAYYPKLHPHNGALYAGWYERTSSARQMRVARYNDDHFAPVWTPVDGGGSDGINHSTDRGARGPQLLGQGGDLYAVWHEREAPGRRQVRVAVYGGEGAAGTWSFVDGDTPQGLNRAAGGDGWWARATSYADHLYVAWAEDDAAGYRIHLSAYHGPTGLWSEAEPNGGFNRVAGSVAEYPHLEATEDAIYLTWTERIAGTFRVFVMRGTPASADERSGPR